MANLKEFKVGDVLLAYGLNMGCHKCVCTIEVVSIDERGIVTNDDGCLFLNTWENMKYANDYFPYSKEQKKAMQEQCDKEYNDWVDECNKESEMAEKRHHERNERLKSLIKEKGYFDGTHTIFELSGKSNFFHWKQHDILHINEDLQIFGMAEDNDTMFLNLDDLCLPTQWEIIDEIENGAA